MHKQRLLDPADHKRSSAKDKALSNVIKKQFGGHKNYNSKDGAKLSAVLKPHYKSIERHEERQIKKGGKKSVSNIKGKIGYFKHLKARAIRRGETDL